MKRSKYYLTLIILLISFLNNAQSQERESDEEFIDYLINFYEQDGDLVKDSLIQTKLREKAEANIRNYYNKGDQTYLSRGGQKLIIQIASKELRKLVEKKGMIKYSMYHSYFLGVDKKEEFVLFDHKIEVLGSVSLEQVERNRLALTDQLLNLDPGNTDRVQFYDGEENKNSTNAKRDQWIRSLLVAAYLIKAEILNSIGKSKEAISYYERCKEFDANNEHLYLGLGNSNYALGNYKEAIKNYDEVIKIDNKYVNAYFNRGLAKFNLKKRKAAIVDFDKTIELNLNYAKAYYMRGLVKAAKKDYTASIKDFDKAIELDNEYADAYYRRGLSRYIIDEDEQVYKDDFYRAKLYGSEDAIRYIETSGMVFPEKDYSLSAEFVYGNNELDSFMLDNFVRPDKCIEYEVDFDVQLSFVVDSSGLISEIYKIEALPTYDNWSGEFKVKVDSLKKEMENEAKRVLKFTDGLWIAKELDDKKTWQLVNHTIKIAAPSSYDPRDAYIDASGNYIHTTRKISGKDLPYDDPIKYYNLGVKKLVQKKYYIAIKYLTNAISLGERTSDVYYNLGLALFFYGEKENACKSWSRAVQLEDQEAKKMMEKHCK